MLFWAKSAQMTDFFKSQVEAVTLVILKAREPFL